MTGPDRAYGKRATLLCFSRNLLPHLHQEVLRERERAFRRLEPLVAANGALDDAPPAENLQHEVEKGEDKTTICGAVAHRTTRTQSTCFSTRFAHDKEDSKR